MQWCKNRMYSVVQCAVEVDGGRGVVLDTDYGHNFGSTIARVRHPLQRLSW